MRRNLGFILSTPALGIISTSSSRQASTSSGAGSPSPPPKDRPTATPAAGAAKPTPKLSSENFSKATNIPHSKSSFTSYSVNQGSSSAKTKGETVLARSTNRIAGILSQSSWGAWFWANSNGILLYQFFLEFLITLVFFTLLSSGKMTAAELQRLVDRLHLSFLVDLKSKEWEEDLDIPGRRPISKEFLTRMSQGHAIAMAAYPIMIPTVVLTYHKANAVFRFFAGKLTGEAEVAAAAAAAAKTKPASQGSRPF
jgi:hypothetical protein